MIVPNLPPAVCGVYDYTRKLAENLHVAAQWRLLCPSDGEPWPRASHAKVSRDGASLSRALLDFQPDVVALQYTCYGYADNGVPGWLADGLETFSRTHKARLAVFFHELSYDGPPWRRAHWRKPKQDALALRLCSLADAVLTGVPQWKQDLQLASRREVIFAPVPANIEPGPRHTRGGELRLGIFGLPQSRKRALMVHGKLLKTLHRKGVAFTLSLMGKGAGQATPGPEEAALCAKLGAFPLSASEGSDGAISAALARCDALLSPYTCDELWKSGAAMAALAHGCALIAVGTPRLGAPPSLTYRSTTVERLQVVNPASLRDCGLAGLKWYEGNSGWPRAAEAWRAALAR